MKIEFIECRWRGKALMSKAQVDLLPKTIGLCATVQFLDLIAPIKKQIEMAKKRVFLVKADNTKTHGQALGCSGFKAGKYEGMLFIGDGMFHPLNLKQRFDSKVFAFDPLSKKMHEISDEDIRRPAGRIKAMKAKFYGAETIGVLISTKRGQCWKDFGRLEKRFPEKRFYYIAFDEINLSQLENFRFIELFINTACPRIGFEDAIAQGKPILNIEWM